MVIVTLFGWNLKDLCINTLFMLDMKVIMIMMEAMLVFCYILSKFGKMAKIQHTMYGIVLF